MPGGGGKAKGKSKGIDLLGFNLGVGIAALWKALKAVWAVLAPVVLWVKTIWDWYLTAKEAIQNILYPLWDIYNNWIRPTLDAIDLFTRDLFTLISTTRAVLEGRIEEIYKALFGPIEELRNRIREGLTNLGSVVALVDKELGNKIIQMGLEFDIKLLQKAREVRDELLLKIRDTFLPLQSRLSEIISVIDNISRMITDKFEEIAGIFGVTLERPGLLSRETVEATGLKWGSELWESMFGSFIPEDISDAEKRLKEELGKPRAEAHILEQIRGYYGKWNDVAAFIDWWGDALAGRPVAPLPPPIELEPEKVEDLKPISDEEYWKAIEEIHALPPTPFPTWPVTP